MAIVYDFFYNRWYKKARKRAWKNERWAEIEHRRHKGSNSGTLMLSEKNGLGVDQLREQRRIFKAVNPRPLYLDVLQVPSKTLGRVKTHLGGCKNKYQRANRGYGYRDLWDFDHYLAGMLAKSCRELAEIAHGYPDEMTFDQWVETLNEMADGFEAYHKLYGAAARLDKTKEKELKDKFDKAKRLFNRHFESLWD